MDLMMGDQYMLTSVPYPEHFPKVKIKRKLEYGKEGLEKISHYHKEGEDDSELRVQRHRWFYICICNIYDLIIPNSMMSNETTFLILRNNFANLSLDTGDRMSTTISKL